jgi:hypothetical protein
MQLFQGGVQVQLPKRGIESCLELLNKFPITVTKTLTPFLDNRFIASSRLDGDSPKNSALPMRRHLVFKQVHDSPQK